MVFKGPLQPQPSCDSIITFFFIDIYENKPQRKGEEG